MSEARQTSPAMGFDINELVIELNPQYEELIAAAIATLRAEMKEKLMAHTDMSTISILLAVPSHIAEAVEARMRGAQNESELGSWVVGKRAASDRFFQFFFERSQVGSSYKLC